MDRVNGRSAEDFFLRSMNVMRTEWPPWLLSVRKADENEDRDGVDFIVDTSDAGEIFVQVKSSMVNAKEYMRKHGHDARVICLFVASNFEETLLAVFQRTRMMLRKYRQNKLEGNPQKFLLSSPFRRELTVWVKQPKRNRSRTTA